MLKPKSIPFSTSAPTMALIRRHDTLLIASAVTFGILLAVAFFIVFGMPWIRDMAVAR